MRDMKTLKRPGFLSNPFDGLLADQRRIVLYADESLMPKHCFLICKTHIHIHICSMKVKTGLNRRAYRCGISARAANAKTSTKIKALKMVQRYQSTGDLLVDLSS